YPLLADVGSQRVAFLCILGSRLEHFRQGQIAELLYSFCPGGRCTGNHDRVPAITGNSLEALLQQLFAADQTGAAAASVEAIQLALVPDQCKGICTDTIGGGLDDRQCSCGSNCGVNG